VILVATLCIVAADAEILVTRLDDPTVILHFRDIDIYTKTSI